MNISQCGARIFGASPKFFFFFFFFGSFFCLFVHLFIYLFSFCKLNWSAAAGGNWDGMDLTASYALRVQI